MNSPSPRITALACASVLAITTGLFAPGTAFAQDTASANTDQSSSDPHKDAHAAGNEIVVVGHPPTDYGLLAATTS
ncbi:MAG: hypothetical protein AB7E24_23945, partial [Novosphingobium sp.]